MNALSKRLLTLGASSIIAVAGGYAVGPWEGEANTAYKDIVGVVTICYGQTKNVKMGDYRTDLECAKDLAEDLAKYNTQMKAYVTVPLLPYEEIAYTSFVWNVGTGAFKSSTLLKKLNAGDRTGACNELLKWNKAGGRVVTGLVNRRNFEHQICLGKNTDVNTALGLVETATDASKTSGGGVGSSEVEKPLVGPPIELPAVEAPTVVACKFKFLGLCWKK